MPTNMSFVCSGAPRRLAPAYYETIDNIVTSRNSASLYYAPYFPRHVFLPEANLLVAAQLVLAPLTPSKTPVC